MEFKVIPYNFTRPKMKGGILCILSNIPNTAQVQTAFYSSEIFSFILERQEKLIKKCWVFPFVRRKLISRESRGKKTIWNL